MNWKKKNELDTKFKTYSVGHGDGYWIDNSKETLWEEANIVIFPGGADINPAIYNEKVGSRTSFWEDNDARHIEYYNRAIKDGKYIIGICRGAQLMCGMQNKIGGKLIQHVTGHHGNHAVKTYDGLELESNSIHHQMLYPWNMPKDSYKVLGWTEGISECYLNGDNKQNSFPDFALIKDKVIEPEFVWFPKIRGLAVQGHPEMMGYNRQGHYGKTLGYLNRILNITFDNNDYFKLGKEKKEVQVFNNIEN